MNLCVMLLLVILANLTKFRKNLIKVIPAPRAIGIHPNPSPTRGHELADEENRASLLAGKMIKGACTRKQKLGVRRLVQKYKQTHSVGKRLGQGRKCKLSSATESNMMNKAKSGKYAPAAMRGYSLNKKNTVVHRAQGEKD